MKLINFCKDGCKTASRLFNHFLKNTIMKILDHVDLGRAFESLKKTFLEVEKEARKEEPTVLGTGVKYAKAFGRLSAAVQSHICDNTDTPYGFHREESTDDLPENMYQSPKAN
jgi:hypothetical protein